MTSEPIESATDFSNRYSTWRVSTVTWSGCPRIERVCQEGTNRRFFRPMSIDIEHNGANIEFETEDDNGCSIGFDVPIEAVAEFMRRAGWNVSRREVIETDE